MSRRSLSGLFAITCSVLIAACSTDVDREADGPIAPPDDAVFSQVDVELGPAGPVIHAPRLITAAAERDQNELRLHPGAAAALTQDEYCSGTSLWLYDRPQGYGNRICFHGSGVASLASFYIWTYFNGHWTTPSTWAISSGTYWPGNQAGVLFTAGPQTGGAVDAAVGLTFVVWGPKTDFNVYPLRVDSVLLY